MARIGQTLSTEELYIRLRQVIADMPELNVDRVTPDLARWLGEAAFLVSECGGHRSQECVEKVCFCVGIHDQYVRPGRIKDFGESG